MCGAVAWFRGLEVDYRGIQPYYGTECQVVHVGVVHQQELPVRGLADIGERSVWDESAKVVVRLVE